MRPLKILTLFLAMAGTLALVLAARGTARPLTAISAVSPSMNFAYVRIEGAVIAYPSLSLDEGYLSFRVQDASGDMRVSAYRGAVEALIAQQQIPMPGDQVVAEGTLRVRDEEPSLTLNAPEALVIRVPPAEAVALSALGAQPIGGRAVTVGQVRRVRDASESLRLVSLRHGDAQAELIIPLDLQGVFGEPPALAPGDWVSVTGGVGEYRGKRQVLPARAADVAPAGADPLEAFPPGGLSRAMIGRWVAVRGRVGKLRPVEGGMLIDLQEGEASVTVVLFDAWQGVPFSQTLKAGDGVTAQGELVDFHGKLEVQAELSIDLTRDD